jgi:hypothetical protein
MRSEIVAVVVPRMAPLHGPVRARAAAAVDESRIGAGLGFFRYTPGNVRFVSTYPGASIVVRKDAFLSLGDSPPTDLANVLSANGDAVLYTPETVVVVDPPPLFRPHLEVVAARARTRARRLPRAAGLVVAGAAAVAAIVVAAIASADVRYGVECAVLLYLAAVAVATLAAAMRFQSAVVGALAAAGIVATHAAYLAGFARGALSRSAA